MERATRFREAAAEANHHREKTGWRYPKALRQLAIDHCQDRRRAGRPWSEISEDLGVSAVTLGRWLEAVEPAQGATFHPVEVVEPTVTVAPGSLRVLTPGGLQIEGLDFAQVLELARAWR